MSRYHDILGVPAHANAEQIKAAYRSLAKRFHPDISKEPNAHEKFVLITEAYEMLINAKEIAIESIVQTAEDKRKQARAKAAAAARMKYEAFTNSSFYRNTVALSILIDLLGFAFVAYILIWINIAVVLYNIPLLLLITLPTIGIAFYGLVRYLKKKQFAITDYFDAARIVFSIPLTQVVLVSVCNVFIFLTIGLNTLIPLLSFITIYILSAILGILWVRMYSEKYRVFKYSIFPSLISAILVINLLFAGGSYETSFKIDRNATGKSTLLQLHDSALDAFPQARFFYSINQTVNKQAVKYQFAHGYFGIMVVQKRTLF